MSNLVMAAYADEKDTRNANEYLTGDNNSSNTLKEGKSISMH